MSKACKEDDCPGIAGGSGAGRGWCSKHYGRWRTHGDVRGKLLTCEMCGETKFSASSATKFCSDVCRAAANARRSELWYEQNAEDQKTYARHYYRLNRDEILVNVKAYRLLNLETSRQRSREYREKYPERVREGKRICYERKKSQYLSRAKAYRDLNREAMYERSKQWQAANPDAVRATKKRYKLRRRGWEDSGFVITQRSLDKILRRANHRCVYCSADLSSGYHWDHVVPLSRGGAHGEGNLVPSCPSCNLSKASSTVMEWRKRVGTR